MRGLSINTAPAATEESSLLQYRPGSRTSRAGDRHSSQGRTQFETRTQSLRRLPLEGGLAKRLAGGGRGKSRYISASVAETRREQALPANITSGGLGRVSVYCLSRKIDIVCFWRYGAARDGMGLPHEEDAGVGLNHPRRQGHDRGHPHDFPLSQQAAEMEALVDEQPEEAQTSQAEEWKTQLHGEVVHSWTEKSDSHKSSTHGRHTMYFDYGCVVLWGFTLPEERLLLKEVEPFLIGPVSAAELQECHDDMTYAEPVQEEQEPGAKDKGKAEAGGLGHDLRKFGFIKRDKIYLQTNDPLEKLSYSFALGQSSKLVLFESRLDETIELSRKHPEMLAQTGAIGLIESEIHKMMGKNIMERHEVNLHSSLLDTPEFFWEEEEDVYELRYTSMRCYLDMERRVEVVNLRLDILESLLNTLSTHLTNKHSSRLELIIIFLIVLEVAIDLFWVWKDTSLSKHHV